MRILSFLFFSIIISACVDKPLTKDDVLPYFNKPDFTPEFLNSEDSDSRVKHKIADFSFLDQNGEPFTQVSVKNRIYVANFFFTICPGICPTMTQNMIHLQNEFIKEEGLLLVSHTVTPWIDTVQQLKKYALENNIKDDKYFLLTGSQEEIYDLARTSYFAEKTIGFEKTEDDFLHSENFLLIDRNRHIRGIYNGTVDQDIQRLKRHIKILLKTY